MNGLTIVDSLNTREVLSSSLFQHYQSQLLGQLYKLLGSVEFIGNPVGLIDRLGSGVVDFFYQPAQGLVKSPQDFGKGLAKGSISLVTNTISGVFNTASKITGAVAKGLAAASMDEKFIDRHDRQRIDQPENVVQGLAQGGKSLLLCHRYCH